MLFFFDRTLTDFIIDRKLDEQAAKQREAERLAEERRLQRERETELRRNEEREREKELARRRTQEKPIPATTGYVPPNKRTTADSTSWRRSTTELSTTNPTNREEGAWRRTGSGRGNVTEDGARRRESARSSTDEGLEWRRSDSGRGSTTEDRGWRRSDSGRGTSTEENRRRTSREESSVKQEGPWRRGGQQHVMNHGLDLKIIQKRKTQFRWVNKMLPLNQMMMGLFQLLKESDVVKINLDMDMIWNKLKTFVYLSMFKQ